jgi:hypothetical protein
MMWRVRTFIIVLTMLALPVEGALAAIMPLCAQAQNISAVPETQIPSAIPSGSACTQHDGDKHSHARSTNSTVDIADFSLSCDGFVCHITGSGLPPAASALDFTGGFSYTILSNSRFSSYILQQPQRPPLA